MTTDPLLAGKRDAMSVELHAAYVIREGEGFIFLSPDDDNYLEEAPSR